MISIDKIKSEDENLKQNVMSAPMHRKDLFFP